MPPKKKSPAVPVPEYPKVVETFRRVGTYDTASWTWEEPICFNSTVAVEKYRITVERIEESVDVYKERLTKLWRGCGNNNHCQYLEATAKRLGVNLNPVDFGKDHKKNS